METTSIDKSAEVPEEIRHWSWGAFFLNAIWGVGNKTYVALFALVPVVNVVMVFLLGVNGNKWAWKNKEWESVEEFLEVQRKWTYGGFAVGALYAYYVIKTFIEIF